MAVHTSHDDQCKVELSIIRFSLGSCTSLSSCRDGLNVGRNNSTIYLLPYFSAESDLSRLPQRPQCEDSDGPFHKHSSVTQEES